MYSQAIEAQPGLQLEQVCGDLKPHLSVDLVPKTWPELFQVLGLSKKRWSLCLDEFPYLTAVDPSLPSQFQKWLDHGLPRGCLLFLSGSSSRMMNDLRTLAWFATRGTTPAGALRNHRSGSARRMSIIHTASGRSGVYKPTPIASASWTAWQT
jgi:hypothetical protein